MKVSDYIAAFFAKKGLRHAFVVSGGASLHLIHSIGDHKDIDFICCHHEQSAAMAADAYTRVTNNPGLAITSSGPGATNLITGICGCYYDSIPAFFITGQVSTFRMSTSKGVRQLGFQETPIVEIVSSITNYSAQVSDPNNIRYELEKAYFYSTHGRPGPVLIDIPDNIQRECVDPSNLQSFTSPKSTLADIDHKRLLELSKALLAAKRPIIIAGAGIHLSQCEKEFRELINKVKIPVALTWGAADLLPSHSSLRVGTFGTHGSRYANFAVQNSDFILSIGSRLDTKATGSPAKSFARSAIKAMVDISQDEIEKFRTMSVDISFSFQADAGNFIRGFKDICGTLDTSRWIEQVNQWKKRYAICNEVHDRGSLVDPYTFFEQLPLFASSNAHFWCDTGSAIAWMMQACIPRDNQRIWHDYNNTAMGWALPASIGGFFTQKGDQNYCIAGDGSLMMNIQELQTVVHYSINLKIICVDNNGYSMIKQTQEQWLDNSYLASSYEGGVSMPDFEKVLNAYGFKVRVCSCNSDIIESLQWLSSSEGPSFLLLKVDECCRVVPQVKFGKPNEDPEPLLERDVFRREMLIDVLE